MLGKKPAEKKVPEEKAAEKKVPKYGKGKYVCIAHKGCYDNERLYKAGDFKTLESATDDPFMKHFRKVGVPEAENFLD
jgi:hypothetical protein